MYKVVTKKDKINSLVKRFEPYKNSYKDFSHNFLENKKIITEVLYQKLLIEKELTEELVVSIMGDRLASIWIGNDCTECHEDREILLQIREDEVDCPEIRICNECLSKMQEQLNK